jgi:uncharacterized RDD family membrane protein YckC
MLTAREGASHLREDYRLLTPENVELQFDVAGLGSRLGAALIDYVIILVAYISLTMAAGFVGSLMQHLTESLVTSQAIERATRAGSFLLLAFGVVLGFLAWWGYFMLFELLWGGQSPGKRLLGLRVVRRDGQPLSFTTVLVRNVLRWIDQVALLGVFVMLIDTFSRRLGDLAAGTFVVHEARSIQTRALDAVEIPYLLPEASVQALPNAGRITMAHYTLIRDYFARAGALRGDAADRLAAKLAGALGREIDVEPATVGSPERFLATVARAFELRHQYTETAPLP